MDYQYMDFFSIDIFILKLILSHDDLICTIEITVPVKAAFALRRS